MAQQGKQDKPAPSCGMGGKGLWKMAICCGGPLLAIALLSGLGISVGSVLGAALPLLLALACPLGMLLMMWSMMRRQRREGQAPRDGEQVVGEGQVIEVTAPRARAELAGGTDGSGRSVLPAAAGGVAVSSTAGGHGDGARPRPTSVQAPPGRI